MKKILLCLLLGSSLIASSDINSFPLDAPPVKKVDNEELLTDKNFRFNYLSFGGTVTSSPFPGGSKQLFPQADLFFGHRRCFASGHAFDGGAGVAMLAYPIPYGQFSYLFYPKPAEGLYFGVGVTINWLPGTAIFAPNIPVTIGYQFPKTKQFIQVQATPYPSATLHYGFGF